MKKRAHGEAHNEDNILQMIQDKCRRELKDLGVSVQKFFFSPIEI